MDFAGRQVGSFRGDDPRLLMRMDVSETASEYRIQVDLPGMSLDVWRVKKRKKDGYG